MGCWLGEPSERYGIHGLAGRAAPPLEGDDRLPGRRRTRPARGTDQTASGNQGAAVFLTHFLLRLPSRNPLAGSDKGEYHTPNNYGHHYGDKARPEPAHEH